MKIGEFFVQLGAKADTTSLKDFAKTIGDLPLDVASAITALAGIEYELTKVAAQAIETAVSFQMFTSQTGLSWQELQKWQIVAEQANVSTEDVASSVSALERNMAEIRLGRGNIAPFQMLGIGVNQNAFGVLQQLRERIKGLNPATATNMITQMGLSPNMIRVLRLSDQEFKNFADHVHGLTERQVGDFLEAKQALVQFGQTFRFMMFDVVSHFTEAIKKSLQFKEIIIGLGIVLAGLAIYFFPITAAIVGLLLLMDDLAVYFTGGKSVFGLMIEGMKELGKEMANSFKSIQGIGQLTALALSTMLPGGAALAAGSLGASAAKQMTVNQNVNMHVHGTGSADDTAKAVQRELTKATTAATLQSNDQGH